METRRYLSILYFHPLKEETESDVVVISGEFPIKALPILKTDTVLVRLLSSYKHMYIWYR
jgi:hypothetical protein